VSEVPLILVVEDDYLLQGVVEDALTDGGFASDILSSAEEGLTLFKGKTKNYKALVADVNLKGRLSGWDVADQGNRPGVPDHLHVRRGCGSMALARCAQQHSFRKTVRASAAGDRRFQPSQYRNAHSVRPP
jgi:ActR/RegA family two-component response regulator